MTEFFSLIETEGARIPAIPSNASEPINQQEIVDVTATKKRKLSPAPMDNCKKPTIESLNGDNHSGEVEKEEKHDTGVSDDEDDEDNGDDADDKDADMRSEQDTHDDLCDENEADQFEEYTYISPKDLEWLEFLNISIRDFRYKDVPQVSYCNV